MSRGERGGSRRPAWAVGLLAALTMLVVLLDLARPDLTAPVRRGAATVFAPAQSVLAGWSDGEVVELTRERNALAARVDQLEAERELSEDLAGLRRSASWGSHELLPSRVVGFSSGSTPVGGRTVTIDVGVEDGVTTDQSVVNVDGLVGRVIRVAPTSSDVLLVGDAGVVVGVRFGADGHLGSVRASPEPGLPPRDAGELTLTALGDSPISAGDPVVTLGSPDSVPYAAGIPLGTVTAVDPDTGQLGRTAVVRPHVDVDTLDLVAVVFVEPR
jgi:rod shape-determining protein MreC